MSKYYLDLFLLFYHFNFNLIENSYLDTAPWNIDCLSDRVGLNSNKYSNIRITTHCIVYSMNRRYRYFIFVKLLSK